MISNIKQQTKDLYDELKRVDWPGQKKVMSATYTVVGISLFVGIYLWGSDLFVGWLLKYLLPN